MCITRVDGRAVCGRRCADDDDDDDDACGDDDDGCDDDDVNTSAAREPALSHNANAC